MSGKATKQSSLARQCFNLFADYLLVNFAIPIAKLYLAIYLVIY